MIDCFSMPTITTSQGGRSGSRPLVGGWVVPRSGSTPQPSVAAQPRTLGKVHNPYALTPKALHNHCFAAECNASGVNRSDLGPLLPALATCATNSSTGFSIAPAPALHRLVLLPPTCVVDACSHLAGRDVDSMAIATPRHMRRVDIPQLRISEIYLPSRGEGDRVGRIGGQVRIWQRSLPPTCS